MTDRDGAVAVIGAGSIGVGWAIVFARAGRPVTMYDPDGDRLANARSELTAICTQLAAVDLLKDVESCLVRVTFESRLATAVLDVEHVQECAPEDLALKRSLFEELVSLTPKSTVLASSSSTIRCSEFALGLQGGERCLVAHPANPPYLLPVVELVPAPFTSIQSVARVRSLMADIGMSVVELRREVEGFVYNRLQGAVLREAYCLVRDGVVDPEDIDTIMHDGLGRRWSVLGPFETADLNTRGGIEAHAAKLGPAYARMGAERGQHDPWTPDLVARVAASVHKKFPLEEWANGVAWRDRALMALQRAREADPSIFRRYGD